MTAGVLPFLLAAGIGCWNASGALDYPRDPSAGNFVFILTLMVTGGAAGVLASAVRSRSSRSAPVGVLAIGGTYLAAIFGHRAGPVSAGLVGLGLLALAQRTHLEIQAQRGVPRPEAGWTWRITLGVALAASALDVVIAVAAGGGRPRPGSPSVLSVAATCALVMALAAAVTVLAEGAPAWLRPGGRTGGNTPL
ncbi:MAG: hypothetical protein QOE24_2059 [Frankiales bacterium]|nr:hypothetical protein [Frankiales bacterium]